MERHDIYQNQIRSEFDDMQARSSLLKDMNKALAALRTNRPTDEKTVRDYGSFVDSQGKTQDVFEWMQAHGISIETEKSDKRGVQSQFDAAINNLKAAIDSANSEGQMALIFLQGLLAKLNDVAALMSNLLSKDQKIKEVIIGNFR
ncbi:MULTISPECIES: hypothetical protein [unclassified Bradyrhizobium]|uniref:hypothetical protein n=1 Tax=unclassified Bradyrhizobium TaxID=2631580 RepID=UPI001028E0F8|nr:MULTISPECIES: hypothetical protein [unclassified Bradyrhizobium]RZN09117.1 hypothetical protein CWO90_47375 [Bradyrhizobium sp. Leo121]TAI59705.1 hypothetical protein CWO89_44820 [Bradyrhizobium sp. Leo170]